MKAILLFSLVFISIFYNVIVLASSEISLQILKISEADQAAVVMVKNTIMLVTPGQILPEIGIIQRIIPGGIVIKAEKVEAGKTLILRQVDGEHQTMIATVSRSDFRRNSSIPGYGMKMISVSPFPDFEQK